MTHDDDALPELKEALDAARAMELRGDARGALAVLGASPAHLLRSGTFHFACASLLVRMGELDRAQQAAREAVRCDPEVHEFQASLGAVLVETWRRTKERALLEEAILVLEGAAALALHELTTQVPHEVYVALPRGADPRLPGAS